MHIPSLQSGYTYCLGHKVLILRDKKKSGQVFWKQQRLKNILLQTFKIMLVMLYLILLEMHVQGATSGSFLAHKRQ